MFKKLFGHCSNTYYRTKNTELDYCLILLSCSTQLAKSTRQNILRKHKSHAQKRKINEKWKLNYANLEPAQKKQCLFQKMQRYNSMDPSEKQNRVAVMQSNTQNWYHSKKKKQCDLDHCITLFQSRIRAGPYYICSVCNRLLYRKSSLLH